MRGPLENSARKHSGTVGDRRYNAKQYPGGQRVPSSRNTTSQTDRHTVGEPTRQDDGAFKPRLIVVSGMLLGQQMELSDVPIIIGRASECALSMPHPSVSRQHCRIWREADRYLIEDLGSTNRTYLNGKPLRVPSCAMRPDQRRQQRHQVPTCGRLEANTKN